MSKVVLRVAFVVCVFVVNVVVVEKSLQYGLGVVGCFVECGQFLFVSGVVDETLVVACGVFVVSGECHRWLLVFVDGVLDRRFVLIAVVGCRLL